MNNNGGWFAFGVCCVWPLVFHFGVPYVIRFFTRRDWKNIQWHNWRKEE